MASKRISRGVCGSVGSGKSSFISCILGEIPKISGEILAGGFKQLITTGLERSLSTGNWDVSRFKMHSKGITQLLYFFSFLELFLRSFNLYDKTKNALVKQIVSRLSFINAFGSMTKIHLSI
ncbi:putative ABC-type xenobiotic transporter [Helianthus annuus]|nr:putative ABC-type xenobiotic transporter [Helianthus annuus]